MRLKLFTNFSTIKQPKCRIKMAAQSCTFSTDTMLRRNQIFRDRTHPFTTDNRSWINFQKIHIQVSWHCDHNRQHWKGHCHQQLDRFLKLTSLLQVLWKYFASSDSFQRVCGKLIWVVQDRPVQSPPFISKLLWGAFHCLRDIDFHCILPQTSLYRICHCLIVGSEQITRSNDTSSNKTLIFSPKFAFCIFLCVWISLIILEMKIVNKKPTSTKISMQQTTDG